MKLTVEREYNFQPFGRFSIKMTKHKPKSLRDVWFKELTIDWGDSVPLTYKQEQEIVKLMRKNKTDILVSDNNKYYTRLGGGEFSSLVRINHKLFIDYKYNSNGFKDAVDAMDEA